MSAWDFNENFTKQKEQYNWNILYLAPPLKTVEITLKNKTTYVKYQKKKISGTIRISGILEIVTNTGNK